MNDIKLAVDTLTDRRGIYVNAEDYYSGSEGEVFANSKWGKVFKSNGLDYVLNFSKTVVDSVLGRLEVASIAGVTPEANTALNLIWEQNQLELEVNEIHRRALSFGDCYAIVWPDDNNEVQISYNSPLTTVMIYDEENPLRKSYAAKVYQTTSVFGKPQVNLNLYYEDRLEKYSRPGELNLSSGNENSWSLRETVENPWGEVPVFHFRTHRPYGTPEHAPAMGAQDAINKLVANQMITVDYLGAPQRYALSNNGNSAQLDPFDDDDPERNNLNGLQSGPGELWYLDGVNEVGEFQAADHKNFTEPIQAYVKWMAALTSTPLHFFETYGQLNSGEALRNVESAFTKKIRDRQRSFGATWRELFRFVLRIEEIESDVQVNWAGVEQIDSSDAWNIAMIKKGMGIPLDVILIDMGYDKERAEAIAARQTTQSTGTAQIGQGVNTHNLAVEQAAQEETSQD